MSHHYPPVFQGAYVAPPERGASGNGATLWGASSSEVRVGSGGASAAGIRVKIADNCKLPPPIDFTKYVFREVQTSGFAFDFGYERALLEERQQHPEELQENGENRSFPPDIEVVDPWEERVTSFTRMGHQYSAVCIALVAHAADSDDHVLSFLKKYDELLMMGFTPWMAAAALLHHKENLEAAAETCLGGQ